MELDGAVCVVTGASRGIGREVARAVHARGAQVGLVARTATDLDELATELGERVATAPIDVTDGSALADGFASLVDRLGPVDVLVNNAGLGAYRSFLDEDPAVFERLMQVNFFATLHATRLVVPSMVARGTGHIVNVASAAGRLGAPFESAYSASKFAVVGLSESLHAELAPHGVHVSLVNPGPVRTSFEAARGVEFQRRIPRPMRPERVARAVVRAIEGKRFEQTLPRWLGIGVVTRAVAPSLYARGLVRNAGTDPSAARSGD